MNTFALPSPTAGPNATAMSFDLLVTAPANSSYDPSITAPANSSFDPSMLLGSLPSPILAPGFPILAPAPVSPTAGSPATSLELKK